jgi:hypothetical protein
MLLSISTLTFLDLETARSVASREIEVVCALATVLAAFGRYSVRRFAVRSLGNIPERLAFELLERASRSHFLSAASTQEARIKISPIQWSSREVVSRALKGLRTAPHRRNRSWSDARVLDPICLANVVRTLLT